MKRVLQIGKRYLHFKNKFYRVVDKYSVEECKDITIDELNNEFTLYKTEFDILDVTGIEVQVKVWCRKWETKKPKQIVITDMNDNKYDHDMVLYNALYGSGRTYVRDHDQFMSEVNKTKYPDAKQTYRFELNDGIIVHKAI